MYRRRLAALAEAYRQFPAGSTDAAELASRAVAVGPGFAGITAPACLTMAETASVAAPDDTLLVERALDAAERSAHNIQDFTFCARTTARVAAMRERWWPSPALDPTQAAAVIGRLSEDRSTPEFSALHVVGEYYGYREPRGRTLMPRQMRTANTLNELATVYQRPIEEFLRYCPVTTKIARLVVLNCGEESSLSIYGGNDAPLYLFLVVAWGCCCQ